VVVVVDGEVCVLDEVVPFPPSELVGAGPVVGVVGGFCVPEVDFGPPGPAAIAAVTPTPTARRRPAAI
jgi:hypothetical protein